MISEAETTEMETAALMSICKLRDRFSKNESGVPINGYSVFSFCRNIQCLCYKEKNAYEQSVQ